jgi:hypothetical protein
LRRQEVNFTDNETGGWNWVHVQLVVIGTGGYGVNGNATHDADIRVGQDVDRIFEQFVLLRVRRRWWYSQPRGMSVLRTV